MRFTTLLILLTLGSSGFAAAEGEFISVPDLARRAGGEQLAGWARDHPDWRGTWDPGARMPRRLYGPAVVCIPEECDLSGGEFPEATLREIARAFGVRFDDLGWADTRRARESFVLEFSQNIAGRPVLHSSLRLVVRGNKLLSVSAHGLVRADLAIPPWPQSALSAESRVVELQPDHLTAPVIVSSRTGWHAQGPEGPRPVLEVAVMGLHPEVSALLRFDLRDGGLVSRDGMRAHADVAGVVRGNGVAGWDPESSTARFLPFALPNLDVQIPGVGSTTTDADGGFELSVAGAGPVDVDVALSGPFAFVVSDGAPELTLSGQVTPGFPAEFLFNSALDEDATAQTHAFLHTNLAHDWVTGILNDPPFTELDFPLQVHLTAPGAGSCNAFFDANVPELRFFAAGGGCPNTAYSSVIYHEYQHAVTYAILGPSPIYLVGPLIEGLSDSAAVLLTGDRHMGRDFYGPGEPLRDVEFDLVHPVAAPIHIRGLVVAGSFWDLRTRLIHELGSEDGATLASRLFLDHLFFDPGPTSIGPEIVTAVLLADDDDGDLGNGTPHQEAITDAFSVHGLAVAPPALPPLREMTDELTLQTVVFQWTLEAPFDEIHVEKDGAAVTLLAGDATSWMDTEVTPGVHTYLFRGVTGTLSSPAVMRWVRNKYFLRGDVNADGDLELDDAFQLLEFLFLDAPLEDCADTADLDDSGHFNLADAIQLLSFLAADGPPPAAPFPAIGIDPVADLIPCADEL